MEAPSLLTRAQCGRWRRRPVERARVSNAGNRRCRSRSRWRSGPPKPSSPRTSLFGGSKWSATAASRRTTSSPTCARSVGNLFKVDNLARDVRALWDSGFFDDIEVDMTREDGGVILRFLVRERAEHQGVEFEGNSEIENDKLHEGDRDQGEHDPQRPARPPQRAEDQGCLRREGLLPRRASRARSIRSATTRSIVKFKIIEHAPVTVRRITFVGNYHVARRRAARGHADRTGRLLRLRLRRPVPAGRLRARRAPRSTPSITTRATSRPVADPARDAHARSRGHRDHAPDPRGARASRSAS